MDAMSYLKLLKRPIEKITVPQFGEVFVRGLYAPEYDRYEHASIKQGAAADGSYIAHTPTLIRYGMVTEAGAHVWSDEHIQELATLPSEVSRPLRAKILTLCGVGVDLGKS